MRTECWTEDGWEEDIYSHGGWVLACVQGGVVIKAAIFGPPPPRYRERRWSD
jgi:hypothetical protein